MAVDTVGGGGGGKRGIGTTFQPFGAVGGPKIHISLN